LLLPSSGYFNKPIGRSGYKSINGKERLGDWIVEPVAVVVRGIIVKYVGTKKGEFLVCMGDEGM
jgi:hypothetical protein